jgi:hypothetical protein
VNLKKIFLTYHYSKASQERGVAFVNQHPKLFTSILELTWFSPIKFRKYYYLENPLQQNSIV